MVLYCKRESTDAKGTGVTTYQAVCYHGPLGCEGPCMASGCGGRAWRAWRAGVEAVHGERVCRAVRGTGLLFSYKYIQTTYYTPHYYTHQSTTPHRLHDSLTYGCLTYGCNPYTLTRACTLRLNPSLGLPSARTLRLNPSLGLPSARTLRFSTPAWEYRPLRPP